MKFSETWLKTLQPKDKAYRVFEKGLLRGFGVQVTPKGTVLFFVCHKVDGVARYKSVGQYPLTSLAAAREAAIEFRRELESGGVHINKSVGTLAHLCDVYLEELTVGGAKTVDDIRRVLNHDVLSVLDPMMQAKDVTTEHVRLIMHRCIERNAGVLANRVRSYLMSAFKQGIKYDNDPRNLHKEMVFKLTANPVELVPRVASFESVGERVLSLEELSAIWNYKGLRLSRTHLMALKMILLCCGLRSSEVTQAKRSEFDLENKVWNLPPKRSKNKQWHAIPLTQSIIDIVEDLITLNPNKSYLFPSSTGDDKPEFSTSLGHAVTRLVEDLEMENWSPRDLRRTCKTWAGQAGLSKEIRDRLQNHALNDVSSKHYDRYLYLNEKREALLKWEKFLMDAVSS